MIKFVNVSKSYDKKIIDKFNYEFKDGISYGIYGESGIGKSTLINLILDLTQPDSGQIIKDFNKASVVFQEDRLIDELSAYKNLKLISDDEQQIYKALKAFNITDYNKKISEFSGGMKRRVALARALLFEGDILIMDEPFSGIDPYNKIAAANNLKKVFADMTIIIVSHNPDDFDLFDIDSVNLIKL